MGSAGEAAMSDLEFQRELSPEQIREALSLLDSTAGAQNQNLRSGDLSPAEEVNLEPDQSSTTMAAQDRPPAAEDPQQRRKHLNVAVVFSGIGIAAAGALVMERKRASTANARVHSRAAPETVGSAAGEERFSCAAGCQAST